MSELTDDLTDREPQHVLHLKCFLCKLEQTTRFVKEKLSADLGDFKLSALVRTN